MQAPSGLSSRRTAGEPSAAGASEAKDEQVMVKGADGRMTPASLSKLRDARQFRWTGETQWKHPLLPARLNQEFKVFTPKPTPVGFRDLPATATDVCLKGSLTLADIEALGSRPLEKLEFSGMTFPASWDSRKLFENAGALQYLSFNGGHAFTLSDDFQGLSKLPRLQTLHLHRAEFMNGGGGEAYRNLAAMHQLRDLSLDRTITLEKAPGPSTLRETADGRQIRQVAAMEPVVVDSLVDLIGHGTLRTLSLRWCSALSPQDRERLTTAAKATGCQISF
ncbi:hypothetical protein [Acidovorax sp. NCPPB 3576]|uniref:hypothetical protein n=1 Tax=Acidovorax sp. NCPPB 3576 TaxID=2940488 RepID=UPI00234BE319|nr:hypothetical protein [Acidovorax sp. NCPPB 3576]WCM87199.1 hypothetical protein M5C98_17780 [Acidovorax sp. NCPPB 3576]